MKTSAILKLAKVYLWNGKGEIRFGSLGLCGAIRRAVSNNRNSEDWVKMHNIIDKIQSSLGKWIYVSSWLCYEHHIPTEKLTHENVQAYRQLWLDELIAQYESKWD